MIKYISSFLTAAFLALSVFCFSAQGEPPTIYLSTGFLNANVPLFIAPSNSTSLYGSVNLITNTSYFSAEALASTGLSPGPSAVGALPIYNPLYQPLTTFSLTVQEVFTNIVATNAIQPTAATFPGTLAIDFAPVQDDAAKQFGYVGTTNFTLTCAVTVAATNPFVIFISTPTTNFLGAKYAAPADFRWFGSNYLQVLRFHRGGWVN